MKARAIGAFRTSCRAGDHTDHAAGKSDAARRLRPPTRRTLRGRHDLNKVEEHTFATRYGIVISSLLHTCCVCLGALIFTESVENFGRKHLR